MVGERGFEPPASASRTQRANQTAPLPDDAYYIAMKGQGQPIFGKGMTNFKILMSNECKAWRSPRN